MAAESAASATSVHAKTQQSGTPVFKIVLTGGPCAGKTTAASIISDHMSKLGWNVFRVPEAATMIFSGGVSFVGSSLVMQFEINQQILKVMLALEDSFVAMAKATGQRSLVLCDRGAMDVRAYMDEPVWDKMTEQNGFTNIQLRDSRYDCVVHLITAADGAVEFYTLANNKTRTEPPEFARELDKRIKQNWMGHPHLYVADNRGDFKTKCDRVLKCICNFVGEPESLLSKRKFLVKKMPSAFPVQFQDFVVDHDYIISNDSAQRRLRRRGQDESFTFTLTTRYPKMHGQRLQVRRFLSKTEYYLLLKQRDPSTGTVKKIRRGFLFKDQYYELDLFQAPLEGLFLLEAYMEDRPQTSEGKNDPSFIPDREKLPDFLEVEREVTDDPEYSMFRLASKCRVELAISSSPMAASIPLGVSPSLAPLLGFTPANPQAPPSFSLDANKRA